MTIVAVAAGVAALSRIQPYEPVLVVGNSMAPTLLTHQFKLASRDFSRIARGDIVVFNHEGSQYIKRVALIEGDRVTEYYYGRQWCVPTNDAHVRFYVHEHFPTRQFHIPRGQLYVVGDNTTYSIDSRTFGPIPADSVIARLVDSDGPVLTLPGSKFSTETRVTRSSDGNWT